MKKNQLSFLLFALALALFTTACKKKPKENSNPEAFAEYISAYPQGLISKEGSIKIILAKNAEIYPGDLNGADISILSISPKIDGTLMWSDARTLTFTPEKPWQSGSDLQFTIHLNKIWKKVPNDLQSFVFSLKVLENHLSLDHMRFRAIDPKNLTYNTISGSIQSSDVTNLEELKNVLKAEQNGKTLNIVWWQDVSRLIHHFVIDSVIRKENQSIVSLMWSGEMADMSEEFKIFTIPALSDFSVLGTFLDPEKESFTINFSDPLADNQALKGLIELDDVHDLSFSIDNTELTVFYSSTISGSRKLNVYPGVKNVAGYAMKTPYEVVLDFKDLKPAVQLMGRGNIIPNSGQLVLPFKAVNLSHVDVYVLKIFANNIPYFMQNNQLNGENDLKRVGRPVVYKKMSLATKGTNLKRWNTFSVDLSKLIKPEPGAIYRVELKFRQAYSLYECEESTEELTWNEPEPQLSTEEYDQPSLGYWDDYYDYDYWDYYEYSERENPCHMSYFISNQGIARNIFASNLALTVKGGDLNSYTAFVADLESSSPMSGILVEFFNFQNQKMGSATTASDGSITLNLKSKPFLAVAKGRNEFAYLRIDDGSSLSLSNFDVSGNSVKKGLKGYIYAERSVWRPGDSVFTTFMLEDAEKQLPANHPVIFEVRDPNGKMIERQTRTSHVNHIYNFPFATLEDAVTGIYTATVKVGGVSTSKSLRIETIKPNRLKINLGFDEKILTGGVVKSNLQAAWLTGATAKNLNTDITLNLRQMAEPFEKHGDFHFVDETRTFYPSENEVFKGQLNEKGQTIASISMGNLHNIPGMLEAVFITRVFEPGGDISFDRQAMPYATFNYFVGMKSTQASNGFYLETDKPITVQTLSLDAKGKPANQKLTATVYAIDWSWWWSSGRHNMANYLYSSYSRLIQTTTIESNQGKGSFKFTVKYPQYGNFLVRVCDDESGHCTSQVLYVDWPESRDRSGRATAGAPTMLNFKADKESYNVGETARLTVPTSESGRLLVSIETGSKILKHMWVDAKSGRTEIEIPVTDEMTPNVYAFVSYIQPYTKSVNDLPIRLYGVIPIHVNHEITKLKPLIKTASEWQPNKNASIVISEENGRAMTYTLAVVDEGLLDITRFKTPDPWNHFYQREALGIRTWDLYDDVLGAFGGKIERNFAVGGDAEIDPSGKKRLNRFTPVVKVLGPFTLKEGTSATHQFEMPNYIGSVRVMAVARQNTAYGSAEKAVPVRKSLMVVATLPRVLSPEEEITLPVQVFAMKNNIKHVKVKVKTNALLKAENKETVVKFTDVGDTLVYFKLKASDKIGKAVVDVTVSSGNESAIYQVELDIRNPNIQETQTQSFVLKPGEEKNLEIYPFGMPGTRQVNLEISQLPNLDLQSSIQYLLSYPHGCTEQTISTAFAQLYLPELVTLSSQEKQEIRTNITYALNKLMSMQASNGGFTTWPGGQVNEYTSAYAGHFMIEAEQAGYQIPGGMKQKWLNYEKKMAQNWTDRQNSYYWNYELQGYRLYVLGLAGEAETGAMNRLRNTSLNREAAWRLAAAYLLAGQPKVATDLMNSQYVPKKNNNYDPTFGSPIRAAAMRLENFLLQKDEPKAFEQAVILINEVNKSNLYTTQSTCFTLMMLGKFIKNRPASPMNVVWQAGPNSRTVNQTKAYYSASLGDVNDALKVKNNGNSEIYINIHQVGVPKPGQESNLSNQMVMKVEYKALDGSSINPEKLKQGTDFKAVVTLSSNADTYKLYDMALTQVFAAGWEIVNLRLLDISNLSGESPFVYQDVRDDRVLTYFNLSQTPSRTYEIRLTAAYPGRYYMPGAQAEAMYYPEVIAKSKGMWVEVMP